MIYHSNSPKEIQTSAAKMAKEMRSSRSFASGRTIALEGELGAGKTTFVQAFVKALGITAKIKSPTFNIIKKYPIPNVPRFVYHIDCYRLKDHKEAIPLGIKDIFKEPDCFVLIEWPERIKKILPKKITIIHIDHINSNTRKIAIRT